MSNAHPTAYRLGRLRFTLSGEGPCVGYLHEEFSALRQGGDASVAVMTDGAAHYAPHMMVDFVEKLPPMAGYSASRPVNARVTPVSPPAASARRYASPVPASGQSKKAELEAFLKPRIER